MTAELSATTAPRSAADDWLSVADRSYERVSRHIAVFAVVGMLIFSALTAIDVLFRAFGSFPLVGFNEVIGLLLPITILACFPAGIARRVHLRITLLETLLGPRLCVWLNVVGALSLLIVMALLTWRIALYAQDLGGRNAVTTILGWRTAPAYWALAALLVACLPGQIVVCMVQAREAWRFDARAAQSSWIGLLFVAAIMLLIAVFLLAALGAFGPATNYFARNAPFTNATIFLGVAWIMILLLVPLGAALTITGLAGMAMVTSDLTATLFGFGMNSASSISNIAIAVLPMFLIMGGFAAASGMSADLYRFAHAALGHRRGGLALATIGGCAAFGAVTGLSVATVATIGRASLPEMLNRGYSPALASGAIAAGGTLGILVPPSGAMIIYGLLTDVSIGKMFIAALIPAAIATSFYMLVVSIYVRVSPQAAPRVEPVSWAEFFQSASRGWTMIVLFAIVIGGIYSGIFTETEAAAIGAGLAFLFGWLRGRLGGGRFLEVTAETVETTAMIFLMLIGGLTFAAFISVSGFADIIGRYVKALEVAPWMVIAAILVIYLLLGCVMDFYAILVITTPVFAPIVEGLGYNLIWWGIMMTMVIEVGLIHPPFGMNAFVLQKIAGDRIPISTIWRGLVPFLAADLVRIALIAAFPILALWLVTMM